MQVGDYVRLDKNRGIRKIKEYEEYIDYYLFDKPVLDRWGKDSESHFGIKEQILKSSPNIMELLEIGDYVNGAFVTRFKTDENGTQWLYTNNENAYGYKADEIKSIVTREQFESIEYRVEADKELKGVDKE